MKHAIILHGTGSTPNDYWFPHLAKQLRDRGYEVSIPQLPHTDAPTLDDSLAAVLDNHSFNEQTVLIGHSSGVPLILSVLERIDRVIATAILVSGFYKPLTNEPEPMIQEEYDWERIRAHCKRFVVLNSDNDPWGCDDKMGKELAGLLGGEFVLMAGEGHMGSTTFNQPYPEFPKLLEYID